MKKILVLLLNNADLLLNILGTFFIAFSFGALPERATQTVKSKITKKEREVDIAGFNHPLLFKIGCGLLIIGFIITMVNRK